MANSIIMLTCKHCGEQIAIGKGYFGSYFTRNEKLHEQLNEFYSKHSMGECTDEIDCSDDAKDHFLILEEGDSFEDLCTPKERGGGEVKPEEAINDLKYQEKMRSKGINYRVSNIVINEAISALEKQIPKKPKLMEKPLINSKYWFYCPNCNASRHTDIKVNCCSYCGQALDWSEEE